MHCFEFGCFGLVSALYINMNFHVRLRRLKNINNGPVADSGIQLPIPLIFNVHMDSEMANSPKKMANSTESARGAELASGSKKASLELMS